MGFLSLHYVLMVILKGNNYFDFLNKQLKELDEKSEEEWEKARQKIEEDFKIVQKEVESFFEQSIFDLKVIEQPAVLGAG